MSERALTVVRDHVPVVSVNEVERMARAAASSGLFPAIKSPEAAMTLMMLCVAEGLHPVQALRRYDIVQGRVAMKSDAMLGEFQARGGRVKWIRCEPDGAEAVFFAPGIEGETAVKWTLDDAKRAGLANKPGPWQQYPRQMLRARVISEGVRMTMPAVVVGLYAPEEVQDFDTKPLPPPPATANNPGTSNVPNNQQSSPAASEHAAPVVETPIRPKIGVNSKELKAIQAEIKRLVAAPAAGATDAEKADNRNTRINLVRIAAKRSDIESTLDVYIDEVDGILANLRKLERA